MFLNGVQEQIQAAHIYITVHMHSYTSNRSMIRPNVSRNSYVTSL